jgi:hypothetical protein
MVKKEFEGKVVTLEEETVEEEEEIIKEEKVEDPRRWYVRLYERNEPIAKDVFAGALYYSEIEDVIGIDTLTPQFSSDIEGFMESDIVIDQADGNKIFVSRRENPKEWIQRLHESVIGKDFYALEAEAVYETYETQ